MFRKLRISKFLFEFSGYRFMSQPVDHADGPVVSITPRVLAAELRDWPNWSQASLYARECATVL